jgi:hypothetical protein
MLSPKELYYQYTAEPCEPGHSDFLGQQQGDIGAGTPYDLQRLSNFLKQLKYPCFDKAPFGKQTPQQNPSGILNTGSDKLCLAFRFLQRLDVEAFTEVQPDIKSGTSHAIRNACDIMRACDLEKSKNYTSWEHRGATEYMQHFGDNFITDCLMTLGPNLVDAGKAFYDRATGCGDMDCLPSWRNQSTGSNQGSALGSPKFKCKTDGDGTKPAICSPCKECKEDNSKDPCCTGGLSCVQQMNLCCDDVTGERDAQFRVGLGSRRYYDITQDEINLPVEEYPLIHIGILKRKSYGGYVNLLNNSGPNFYSCPGDLLLKYFQKINGYNYITHTDIDYSNSPLKNCKDNNIPGIQRVKTISLLHSRSSEDMMQSIKDLCYNGYGVVIMTNVGFSNVRDSSGLSYPDRIWYHSYAIIGYDDRKVDYNECVFLLANSWGKWNDGGHPTWGPIPDGSFLVTESHLKCMLKLLRTDQKSCKGYKPADPAEPEVKGCVNSDIGDTLCSPWSCDTKQKALGMVFALSFYDGFPKNELNYTQFYKVRENSYEEELVLYLDGTQAAD